MSDDWFCIRCGDHLICGKGEDRFCPTCEFPRTITNYPIEGPIHIYRHKGWWYYYKGRRGRMTDPKIYGGFQELPALIAKLLGGDVGLREWSKANPR